MRLSAHLPTPALVAALLALGALNGCGGPPEANGRLTDAREAYAETVEAEDVPTLAPAAMAEAREALDAAERAWRETRDTAEVSHRAYVVLQRLRIARQQAELRATEEAIRQARQLRNRTLVALQAAKAEAAATPTATPDEEDATEAEPPATSPPPEAAPTPDSAALGAVLTRRGLVLTLGDGTFAPDEAALPPAAAPTLTALVDFLNAYPERRIQIEGFTDASGTRAENRDLAQRRADAVQAALQQRGIAAVRMTTRAFGAAYPLVSDDSLDEQRRNHRVEIIISDPRGVIPERE